MQQTAITVMPLIAMQLREKYGWKENGASEGI